MRFSGRLQILALCLVLSVKSIYASEGPALSGLSPESLAPISDIVERQISEGNIPGAVVLIGNDDRVIYRKAFGYRSLKPEKALMTEDTVFDIASLTKVVATTTAVMQLVEQGKLSLDQPAARYWPELGTRGKGRITIRHLLTHSSGLRADLSLRKKWLGYDKGLSLVINEKPRFAPGTRYIYSDINFLILGEIVRRISGTPLDQYCEQCIFKPLGMNDSRFNPSRVDRDRIAPTEYEGGNLLMGEVHDPTSRRMGGVTGHAGLFSTADDLSVFARTLLKGGSLSDTKILDAATLDKMAVPFSYRGKALRGLGWKIEPPFASNRDDLPAGALGHTGFTGTSLWIDPVTRTYVIILTNRVHPNGRGDAGPLRKEIAEVVSSALGPLSADQVLARRSSLGPLYATAASYKTTATIRTGLDVLAEEKFSPLAGLRIGLITNHSGVTADGRHIIDLVSDSKEVRLSAIFSPEHGLYGNVDETVASGMDPATNLPVYSLYGEVKRPTSEMLEGLDALVFDMQDAGARFYTYITTMAYAMEEAAKRGIDFYVLDRPNPIDAGVVQGPVLDANIRSFVSYFPLPVRYGMTMGELAMMFNEENKIGARLHVIKMSGYQRDSWYDETGLEWSNPSPNLRSVTEAALYPAVGMVEGANVSVGRGTEKPFELVGAPWINGKKLAAYLNRRNIKGVRFAAATFTPEESIYHDKRCRGIRIILEDRRSLDAPRLGVEIAGALYRLYPRKFNIDETFEMIGSRTVMRAIKKGKDPELISRDWQDQTREFAALREKYLLY